MILNEDQRQIRDMARQFASERVRPFAAEWDRAHQYPKQAVQEMGELGFFGMSLPEAWGGSEVDTVSYALALEEIAAGDGALSTIMSVHCSIGCGGILSFGSDAQKQRFLPGMATGESIAAFALTEPHCGSDASALRTRAVREGNDWVLNGTKQFITSGSTGAVVIVIAKTDPDSAKSGMTAFLVPTDTPGYTVASVERKLGQHASDTCQIVLDNVRIGDELRLGDEGQGYRIALSNLENGRIGIAAQAVGMARAAFEAATDFVQQREAFGKRLVDHQSVAYNLADMATQIAVARQMVLHAATLKQAGEPCLTEASMAKLFASEMAEKVCTDAIQLHGGYGYVEDYPVERIWRDVRVCKIYEGVSDVQRLVIARSVAGAAV